MIAYAIIAPIVLLLAFELLYKAEYRPNAARLFGKRNSNAAVGFGASKNHRNTGFYRLFYVKV